jgi:hypothetical protein
MEKDISKKDIEKFRKAYPKSIFEELSLIQPINVNLKSIMESMSGPYIFKCSCGKILINTSDFLKETEIICGCGKKWELKPIDSIFKMMWQWKEIKI